MHNPSRWKTKYIEWIPLLQTVSCDFCTFTEQKTLSNWYNNTRQSSQLARMYMQKEYDLPYGKQQLAVHLDDSYSVDLFLPKELSPTGDENDLVCNAIRNPLNLFKFSQKIGEKTRVAISINDKTRPVPNNLLFPPLLKALEEAGVRSENILLIIATGTHQPMPANEFGLLLNDELLRQVRIVSHDCDDDKNLQYKGTTTRGTPVFVNSLFDQADIRIVVGDIEPHHFAGFSGGVKSASIGLCGRKTINTNHRLLQDPASCVGNYETNPLRQDIEEIGTMIGVDAALNAILNEKKEIIHAFFGQPREVMQAGIKIIRDNCLTPVEEPYDLVIASAGGYPKDINLYQAQKALTHASLFCRDGGTVILAAACAEGVGSQGYVDFMQNVSNLAQVREQFAQKGFTVGPHKAFQFAAIAERIKFKIKCEIDQTMMTRLLIPLIDNLQSAIDAEIKSFSHPPRVAVIPFATATIPQRKGAYHGS